MILEILFTIVALIILWFINDRYISGKNLPPGPLRVPILGTWSRVIASLAKPPEIPYIAFKELAQQYGPIVTFKGGSLWQMVIDDPEIMKEMLTREDFSDRGENAYILERSWGKPMGILFGNGEAWKEMRRFSIRTLRDFGFGKQKSQESLMEEELHELFQHLNETIETNKGIVSMNNFFTVSVLNILWSMIAGIRFSHKDPKLQSLVRNISDLMTTISAGGNLFMAFPFLRHIFALFPGGGQIRKQNIAKLHKEFQAILDERRRVGHYKEEQRDFIDVFIHEIDKHRQKGETTMYNDKQFMCVIFDLFIAGSETTANTSEFAVLYMMQHPEVQKKVQEEIDRVVGRSRFPNSLDRPNMPYTEATIHEIQRWANVVPMIGRSPINDTTLRGYKIPKETFVVANIHSAHLNPTVWSDPDKFQPERFLDKNNKIINTDKLFVFGTGRRVCIGELMARTTLFTYFATILQNYTFEFSTDHPRPSLIPRFGLTMSPQPYVSLVKPRSFV